MTLTRPCVVGFGELVWDALPHATLPGGAPANFVWHSQQLGAEGILVSAVGDDASGRGLSNWLAEMKLDAGEVQVNALPTGRVEVHVNEQGEPGYLIKEHVAWDEIRWTDSLAILARRADCVCFGTLSQRSLPTRETLRRFLGSTRDDCLRIFDVNLRSPLPADGVIEASLPFTDVLKLNENEWPFVATQLGLNPDWSIGCRQILRGSAVCLVAITRGAQGSVLLSEGEAFEWPADTVAIHDTIGAGDAFSAALAVGLFQKAPIRDIQRVAATMAAFVCTQAGATPRLPEYLKDLLKVPVSSVHLPLARLPLSKKAFVSSAQSTPTAQYASGSRDSQP